MYRKGRLPFVLLAIIIFTWEMPAQPDTASVGSLLQLFLDDSLIESMENLRQVLHHPEPREVVLRADRPYEDGLMYNPMVIKEGYRYRMWYRANFFSMPSYTGYAESLDGIHWHKPDLGLIEYKGSKKNNLVWPVAGAKGRSQSIFRDDNPAAPVDERYKAIGSEPSVAGRRGAGIYAMVSPDGLQWRPMQAEPLLVAPDDDPQFDSHNIAMWDGVRGRYVIYARGWYRMGRPPAGSKRLDLKGFDERYELANGEVVTIKRVRDIRRYESRDFRTWTAPEYIGIGGGPLEEHLYKNAAVAYYRRPDLILMFPMRLYEERTFDREFPKQYLKEYPKAWNFGGLTDVAFMFSQDGKEFDRRYMEGFLRPGRDEKNWHARGIEIGPTLVRTGEGEMSVYYMEHYYLPDVQIRRGVLREDGFVSVQGGYKGGKLRTKKVRFEGRGLEINYATSAVGEVRVGIEDAAGKEVPGYGLDECEGIFGDEIAREVRWKGGADVSGLAGREIRLRFSIKDGDLYSFRFR